MRNNSKARLAMEDGDISFRKPEHRMWRLGCFVLALCCGALLIALITVSTREYVTSDSQICNSPHCVETAAAILENMNANVKPCDNFFEFACGGWIKKNIIPEDKFRYSVFDVLRNRIEIVLKDLLERENEDEIDVLIKVKDLYKSCIDLEAIEKRDAQPLIDLLQKLGGWPVLMDLPGGNWNASQFNLEKLIGTLAVKYYSYSLLESWVAVDDKNSSRYLIKIDQPHLTPLRRKYYLNPEYAHYKAAYLEYMTTIAMMLGADEATAVQDMTDVLEFETTLANMSTPDEDRRDNNKLYNPTTIAQLQQEVPEINWMKYITMNMPDQYKPVLESEPLINCSPEYIIKAAKFVNKTSPRITTNFLIWRMTVKRVAHLNRRFRDALQEYNKILYGTSTVQARWRTCIYYVNTVMGFATGRMYVLENFGGDSKKITERMILNLKKAFKDMLKNNKWMDEETKQVAGQKCDAMNDMIGYPDWIMDDVKLYEKYSDLHISRSNYFENILNELNNRVMTNWLKLRKTVDKNEWTFGPAVVNAYFSSPTNQIDHSADKAVTLNMETVFPAGILQPPFYHSKSPWYLNYGGIGMVIGHEITHGFDDKGRQYDKEGNLQQWWSDKSIKNFKEQTRCIVNQYGQYVMPENNRTLNGIQTQGENIADNGGLAEAFKAYTDNDQTSLKLVGLTNYTSEQLFFLNFAQVWCSAFRPEGADWASSGVHSPGRYRIIGPAHNSEAFAKAFKCPPSSFMNPSTQTKCHVW